MRWRKQEIKGRKIAHQRFQKEIPKQIKFIQKWKNKTKPRRWCPTEKYQS